MKKSECHYFVTDVVSVPVSRIGKKGEAYKMATKPGYMLIDWYSETNNYYQPVNRDKEDKSQVLYCDDDSSGVLYHRNGDEFCISPNEEIHLKDLPKQAELDAIVIGDSCGYTFWAKEDSDVKIFVTYDENGLIDTYRLDNWNGKPYDGEVEISLTDLQSEKEYDKTDRANIIGTLEYERKKAIAKKALQSLTRLRQGYNLSNSDNINLFIEDQKIYAECTKILNVPEDYSNNALHSLQLISRGVA